MPALVAGQARLLLDHDDSQARGAPQQLVGGSQTDETAADDGDVIALAHLMIPFNPAHLGDPEGSERTQESCPRGLQTRSPLYTTVESEGCVNFCTKRTLWEIFRHHSK